MLSQGKAKQRINGAFVPIALSSTNRHISALCDSVFGGSCYIMEAELLTWADARARCVQLGGHLVIIESQSEDQFIAGLYQLGKRHQG